MSPVLLVTWSLLFSLCWMLPLASPPWSTFPADAWAAVIALLGAFIVALRVRLAVRWHAITCWVAVLAVVPWLQFWLELLPYAGQAWISSAYLLGLLLTLLVGAQWERVGPLQLADGLFLAIGCASVASVGLQLYEWLAASESGGLGVLFTGFDRTRPAGNLGQPNQLATLLMWGLLAVLWAYLRKLLGAKLSTGAVTFLLVGLALTQSRTSLLSVGLMVVAVWSWRRLWPNKLLPWVVTGFFLFFLTLPVLLQSLNEALLLGQEEGYFRLKTQSDLRLKAWGLFFQTALDSPWWGYGLTETTSAQMAGSDGFAIIGSIFSHSHNLFLDLVLWLGLPLGLITAVVLIRWFWLTVLAVKQPQDLTLMLLLASLGLHALLEFPLQYAYFLLPAGLVMGILNTRLGPEPLWSSPSGSLVGLCLAGALALGLTTRDYSKVYTSYTLLRLEQGLLGQGRPPLGGPPDVWVLTNLREWIRVSRVKPKADMSQSELSDMETIAKHYPSLSAAYKLSVALALNGRPDEARAWLARICKFTDEKECRLAQKTWEKESPNDPRTAAIQWPK